MAKFELGQEQGPGQGHRLDFDSISVSVVEIRAHEGVALRALGPSCRLGFQFGSSLF